MQKTNKRSILVSLLFVLIAYSYMHSGEPKKPDDPVPYASYVKECLDILVEHGVDRYGDVHAPILVSILDIETRACPPIPEKLDEIFVSLDVTDAAPEDQTYSPISLLSKRCICYPISVAITTMLRLQTAIQATS